MHLYFDYMQERDPEFNSIVDEYGFATYRYLDFGATKAVYIEDLYVKPCYRKSNKASELSEKVQKIAKEKGCTMLLGTVDITRSTASRCCYHTE